MSLRRLEHPRIAQAAPVASWLPGERYMVSQASGVLCSIGVGLKHLVTTLTSSHTSSVVVDTVVGL